MAALSSNFVSFTNPTTFASPSSKMNDYETRRQEKIKQNQKLLAELDIQSLTPRYSQPRSRRNGDENGDGEAKPPAKKRRLLMESVPSRASARIASAPVKANYNEDDSLRTVPLPHSATNSRKTKANQKVKAESASPEPLVPARNIEEIQAGWSSWKPIAESPTRDEQKTFHFDDYPTFMPNKSPEEMLREGVFGGSYFRPLRSRKLGIVVSEDWRELPPSWTEGLPVERYLTSPDYDPEVNKYKVACGQSIEEWEAAGWIDHANDVRGWFQWYCRFFQGRRCDDDERQVGRWKKCVGETGRWRRTLLKKYMLLGVREVFDDGEGDEEGEGVGEVSPVVHQTCFHWAFEVRQEHLDAYWASGGRL